MNIFSTQLACNISYENLTYVLQNIVLKGCDYGYFPNSNISIEQKKIQQWIY